MTDKRRIGLREIATLDPNNMIWDTEVSCFGARRQNSESISLVTLFFIGRQRTGNACTPSADMGRHGHPRQLERKQSAFWAAL
jgi:hypothetical protein